MMIRINLLPVRAAKKRETGRQILVLFAAMLIAAVAGNWVWYSSREDVRARSEERINQTQARITELEKVIGEVNNINKRKKEVQEKLDVLTTLRKGRSGPVRLLDALATATPKKVWLVDFDEKGNQVRLTGKAVSHEEVAELMRGLQNTVWTPKGLGRVIEQKKDGSYRVELLNSEGSIEEIAKTDVGNFFTGIDLRRAEQHDLSAQDAISGMTKIVDFEIAMSANYAI
jgi:type IV pilus assembly protein PilN